MNFVLFVNHQPRFRQFLPSIFELEADKGVVQVFTIEWDFRGSEITIFANISISKGSHVHRKSWLFTVADVDIRI